MNRNLFIKTGLMALGSFLFPKLLLNNQKCLFDEKRLNATIKELNENPPEWARQYQYLKTKSRYSFGITYFDEFGKKTDAND